MYFSFSSGGAISFRKYMCWFEIGREKKRVQIAPLRISIAYVLNAVPRKG